MAIDLRRGPGREALEELKHFLDAGNLSVLVGAGLSVPAGVPTWEQLLRRLAKKLPRDLRVAAEGRIAEGSYLDAAQLTKTVLGDRFYRLMDRIFFREPAREVPGLAYPLLARIPFRTRLTTNYDRLIYLDDVLVNPEKPLTEVTWEEASYLGRALEDRSQRLLFYLHGMVTRPQTIVLTRDDYRERFRDPAYRSVLERVMARPMLILGFGLADLDVMAAAIELTRLFEIEAPRIALAPANGDATRKWTDFHVQVVEYEPSPGHPEVLEFLERLLPGVRSADLDPEPDLDADPGRDFDTDKDSGDGGGSAGQDFPPPLDYSAGREPSLPLGSLTRGPLLPPPVRRLSRRPFMAPLPSRPFAGRERELERYVRLLNGERGGRPYVPIAGLAGVGKTTLAMQLAHRLGKRFPDGVLWLRMGESGWRGALSSFESELGLSARVLSDESRADALRTTIERRSVLVVFDDVRSPDDFLPLVPTEGDSRVLVTTRDYALARQCGVEPLVEPELEEGIAILGAHAGSLLVEEDADTAEKIVTAIGGLPLALEVAGTVAANQGTLQSVLAAASEGGRGLAEPLEQTLEEIWRRLEDGARKSLCVFGLPGDGSVSLEALASTTAVEVAEAGRLAARLRRAGLVRESGDRLVAHALVRDFARRRLDSLADGRLLREGWRDYYVGLASQIGGQWDRGERRAVLGVLTPELPNLDALLRETEDRAVVEGLVAGLITVLHSSRSLVEAESWLKKAIEIAERLEDESNLATRYNDLSQIHKARGDLAEAERWLGARGETPRLLERPSVGQ